MLQCKNIIKIIMFSDMVIGALKGIDLSFRKNEFVSILGPSGCGKTTLLNIIGGLDRYTSGDLVIKGRSTKSYKDHDWDSYRNHSIGFVFQSYNLIQHQTILENVELALTLSGISKSERVRRAKEALSQVGLDDQIKKRPNQLSGGQMQRVAIARALVNHPDILLADEPTGALDSDTSTQIMDILKEIAKTKLVIMVTHNSEIANKYSNRIIKLLDGKVIDDSNPHVIEEVKEEIPRESKKVKSKLKQKTSMSFINALFLSYRNLTTKKTRTFLTAFAGSIGIIGIALVLSLSTGFQRYVDKMQADTLSSYPLIIDSSTIDYNSFAQMNRPPQMEEYPDANHIYVNTVMEQLTSLRIENKITDEYVTNAIDTIDSTLYYDIKIKNDVKVNIFKENEGNKYFKIPASFKIGMYEMKIWQELLENEDFIRSQYDMIAGVWPTEKNQIVLVVDKYNQLSDLILMGLGITNYEDLDSEPNDDKISISYDTLIGMKYKLLYNNDLYIYDEINSKFVNNFNKYPVQGVEIGYFSNSIVDSGVDLEICAILRPNEETAIGSITGAIGYSNELSDEILSRSLGGNGFEPSSLATWYYEKLEAEDYINPFTGEVYIDVPNGETAFEQFKFEMTALLGSYDITEIEIYPIDFKSKI